MMRLSPPGHFKFSQTDELKLTFGGGEANVAISLAYFGLDAVHVTRFPDNFIGKAATQFLRHHWLDTSNIVYGGDRIGQYFLENGAVHRSSEIVYDRDNSGFATLDPSEFDWKNILKGADWFHWTGITPAISLGTAQACMDAIKAANELGVTVSGDVFSRRNLWNYGKERSEILSSLVSGTDVVIASPFDVSEVLGISLAPDLGLQWSTEKLKKVFPRVKKVFDKDREAISGSHNRILGKMWDGKEEIRTPNYDITHIVDRVGTGDAFAAGLIYGLLHYSSDEAALNFATAACALKHTIEGDANIVSVVDVENLVGGDTSGRIKR